MVTDVLVVYRRKRAGQTGHRTVRHDPLGEGREEYTPMISIIARCAALSLTMNVAIMIALRFGSEAVFARSANAAAALVSTVSFFWFLSHSLIVTRVGERLLGPGRRGSAIAITVALTFVQIFAVLVLVAVRAFMQFQR